MLWGKHYIVDPYAINASGSGLAPSGTTSIIEFTGVTGILPYAISSNSSYQTSTVEMAVTGSTGYAISGNTPITVWAPVNPGATEYSVDGGAALSGASYQPVYVRIPFGGGIYGREETEPNTSLTSGGSIWGINKPGESITFKYIHGSGTSVSITNANIIDVTGE